MKDLDEHDIVLKAVKDKMQHSPRGQVGYYKQTNASNEDFLLIATNNFVVAVDYLNNSKDKDDVKQAISNLRNSLDLLEKNYDLLVNENKEVASALNNFMIKKSDLLTNLIDEKIPKVNLLNKNLQRQNMQDIIQKFKNKAYAQPSLELAQLRVQVINMHKHASNQGISSTEKQDNLNKLLSKLSNHPDFRKEDIEKWKRDAKPLAILSVFNNIYQKIDAIGKDKFGTIPWNAAIKSVAKSSTLSEVSTNTTPPKSDKSSAMLPEWSSKGVSSLQDAKNTKSTLEGKEQVQVSKQR